jgi:hypothetical protein
MRSYRLNMSVATLRSPGADEDTSQVEDGHNYRRPSQLILIKLSRHISRYQCGFASPLVRSSAQYGPFSGIIDRIAPWRPTFATSRPNINSLTVGMQLRSLTSSDHPELLGVVIRLLSGTMLDPSSFRSHATSTPTNLCSSPHA